MEAMKFNGQGWEYFKIWIVNILLTIITLGFYYPWAKVRNKRYLYANSSLQDRNFEYHATGKQLFIGYLISVGLFILYVVLESLSPVLGLVVLLIFLAALPWIIWRSLKFNLHVSSFSNVRFSFHGSIGGAYFNYMLLPILFFLSLYAGPLIAVFVFSSAGQSSGFAIGLIGTLLVLLGIALAVYVYGTMQRKVNEYYIRGVNYGQGHFDTQLDAGVFVKIAFKSVVLGIAGVFAILLSVAVLSFIVGASGSLLSLESSLTDPEALGSVLSNGSILLVIAIVYLGFIGLFVAVASYAYARRRRYIFAKTQLDEKIRFESLLSARSMIWVSLSNLALIAVTLGFATPWATVRMMRLLLENTKVDTSVGFEDYVTQKQAEQSSLGDQIGDAFDVDIGLGI